jgi:hypothetical protein
MTTYDWHKQICLMVSPAHHRFIMPAQNYVWVYFRTHFVELIYWEFSISARTLFRKLIISTWNEFTCRTFSNVISTCTTSKWPLANIFKRLSVSIIWMVKWLDFLHKKWPKHCWWLYASTQNIKMKNIDPTGICILQWWRLILWKKKMLDKQGIVELPELITTLNVWKICT